MSEEQHEKDAAEKVPHHPDGGCLNRHVGDAPLYAKNKHCSHRYQAYEKMKDTKQLYDWPKYKPLTDAGKRRRTARKRAGASDDMYPKYYRTYLDPPIENGWDVEDGDNFEVRCYDPYWHEAHHVVPNSILANAIAEVYDGEYTTTIRRGLSKAKYNLNDKLNMIMLPMDKPVAEVLELPRHRKTATVRSHKAYSRMVKSELDSIISEIGKKLKAHEARNYSDVKKDIESLSERLFDAIVQSEAPALDDMKTNEFEQATNDF